jgi:hypothetical protein
VKSEKIFNADDGLVTYDELGEQFIMTGKYWDSDGNWKNINNPRQWGIRTSHDFRTWAPLQTTAGSKIVFAADKLDQEMGRKRLAKLFADPNKVHPIVNNPEEYMTDVYEFAVFPYEGLYLGLASIFDRSGKLPYGNQAGVMHLQLAMSRNLVDWQRAGDREPFLDLADKAKFDSGLLIPTTRPVVMGDELWFYYVGLPQAHDRAESRVSTETEGIGIGTLRRDGFASLRAGAKPGTMTTVPLQLAGGSLMVNVDASGGNMVAALFRPDGSAITGFGYDDCVPIQGDQPHAAVQWHGNPRLPTGAVRVGIRLVEADLYSLWTTPP